MSAQFKKDIETLLVRNIATGMKDANGKVHFFGDHNVTRGQVAAFLFRVMLVLMICKIILLTQRDTSLNMKSHG